MTKLDRVSKGDEGDVLQKEFQEREQTFIKALGLAGVTTLYLTMYNYCDDTDKKKKRLTSTIFEIDAPALQFMTQICDPAIKVTNPEFIFTSKGKEWPPKAGVCKRKEEQEQNQKNGEIEQKARVERKNGIDILKTVIAVIVVFVIIIFIYAILFKFFV